MTLREAKAVRADKLAQERGPRDARVPVVAPHLLHRTHPTTGLDVVFIVGELLPEWVEVSADD